MSYKYFRRSENIEPALLHQTIGRLVDECRRNDDWKPFEVWKRVYGENRLKDLYKMYRDEIEGSKGLCQSKSDTQKTETNLSNASDARSTPNPQHIKQEPAKSAEPTPAKSAKK